jgi:hypothetical protein
MDLTTFYPSATDFPKGQNSVRRWTTVNYCTSMTVLLQARVGAANFGMTAPGKFSHPLKLCSNCGKREEEAYKNKIHAFYVILKIQKEANRENCIES